MDERELDAPVADSAVKRGNHPERYEASGYPALTDGLETDVDSESQDIPNPMP